MRKFSLSGFVVAAVLSGGLRTEAAEEPRLGRIDFPTSGSAPAQRLFLRGVLLLHSFEYEDAREQFQAAEKAEPGFAMAYWGEAMTYNHPIWMQQDAEAARRALGRLGSDAGERAAKAPTAREKGYLHAVETLYGDGEKDARDGAYAEEMGRLAAKYPDDDEAAAFHALSLLGTCHAGRDFAVYMRAAGILEQIYQRRPEHPGVVHYLIHCYDDPIHAPLGLRPARVYARIAAAASHAQHMPSHIFLALGMWDETAASNETAWAVSVERARRKGLGADEYSYHALYWLEYAYLQQGRYADARRMLAEMEKDAGKTGSSQTKTQLSWMRAQALVEGAIDPPSGDPTGSGLSAAAEWAGRGLAGWRRRDLAAVRHSLEAISADAAGPAAAGHGHGSAGAYGGDKAAVHVLREEMRALAALSEGRREEALGFLRDAAEAEDRTTFGFGPPEIVKPSRELLAEALLDAGRPAEAAEEFRRALAREPGRAASLHGLARACRSAGDAEAAARAQAEYRRVRHRADPAPPAD
jgi:tetratricopeptide (TPR) repeat protein